MGRRDHRVRARGVESLAGLPGNAPEATDAPSTYEGVGRKFKHKKGVVPLNNWDAPKSWTRLMDLKNKTIQQMEAKKAQKNAAKAAIAGTKTDDQTPNTVASGTHKADAIAAAATPAATAADGKPAPAKMPKPNKGETLAAYRRRLRQWTTQQIVDKEKAESTRNARRKAYMKKRKAGKRGGDGSDSDDESDAGDGDGAAATPVAKRAKPSPAKTVSTVPSARGLLPSATTSAQRSKDLEMLTNVAAPRPDGRDHVFFREVVQAPPAITAIPKKR
ncbi:hypothetical protein CXG81DRAFT_24620 [Caulochytrium protostelioides]|uniref:Uncharacterized protein n=1 Tax=Caulochytrium protostelioides TaxID=1555241 RepID=A0A4P9XC54_9FUNG|nr:hypothetical protein CXG81DRAFT_24620 [Caulochytrium protostelioides]|eukprot:RKP02740.1 hypothetical protein CXG81DRAFT_24620 [Caulochytrium protostelioides]